jgi:arylformamidase
MLDQAEFDIDGHRWRADLSRPLGLAVALDFSGPQPSFFGAPPATATALRSGSFIGDIAQGGSCRCSTLSVTPHCNGTHTECVGHVVAEAVSVHDVAREAWLAARVVTVTPDTTFAGGARITARQIERALGGSPVPRALVVRTLPNPASKATHPYLPDAIPPSFDEDAVRWLVERHCRHLVVDLPSIDRADDASLKGHRVFWGLPPGSRRLADSTRPDATITELAYIADSIVDGPYLLNLQVAPFASDAAPSRPVLFPLAAVTR